MLHMITIILNGQAYEEYGWQLHVIIWSPQTDNKVKL